MELCSCAPAKLWLGFGGAEATPSEAPGASAAREERVPAPHPSELPGPGRGQRGPGAGGVGAALGSEEPPLSAASAMCCDCLCKNNRSFQIFITRSCAEERVPCAQKWKTAPEQLPIWVWHLAAREGQEAAAGGTLGTLSPGGTGTVNGVKMRSASTGTSFRGFVTPDSPK